LNRASFLDSLLHASVRLKRRLIDARNTRRRLESSAQKRIVIGAGGICAPDWVPTEMEFLDLLAPGDWERLLQPGSLAAILAEHVWEHLEPADAQAAARTCFRYLRPGGHLRAAVPDGLHADPAYIASVKVGGSGAGADDHRVLYRYDTFAAVFESVGFKVKHYEYFDETGRFNCLPWDPRDGMIWRSMRYDDRNRDGKPNYTSIVLDAFKADLPK
jgi:predicted SAM-dependent methyltransferase